MKIHKLNATFGKLQRQSLELMDGLNIIEAPNESGKSTWAAFIRAMLYGINTRERDRYGFIAEKNLYQPWDGGTMEGSAQLSWGGREITLRRTSKNNAPLGQFQAVYTGTEEAVPELTGDNAGELLTGVGREAFERSAFVGQSSIAVTGSAELERRISAIVSSGQEDVSYSETEQQLREWKNRRQSNQKNGLIPRLEEEKGSVTATLSRLDNANQQAAAARLRISELEAEQAHFEQQQQAHRALSMVRVRERYDTALSEYEQAQAALDAVLRERRHGNSPPNESALLKMQGDLSYLNTLDENIKQARREMEDAAVPSAEIPHPVFQGMDPGYARRKAEEDLLAVNHGQTHASRRLTISIILFVIAAVMLVSGLILRMLSLPVQVALASALCGVLAAVSGVLSLIKCSQLKKKTAGILKQYGAADACAISEQAEDYANRWQTTENLRSQAIARSAALARLQSERDELSRRLLTDTQAFAPEVSDLFGVSAALSLAMTLGEKERTATLRLEGAEKVLQAITAQGVPTRAQAPEHLPDCTEQEAASQLSRIQFELSRQNEMLAMAQGEINTLGDHTELQAKLQELDHRLALRRQEYDAISIAMDALKQANSTLQERMSPALNKRSGELLHLLTGGKYDQVSLTREFEALAARHGDITPHKLLTLSKGTADQLYLAVRLAVCDLVLPGDDPAPLILDDALVNFDDERMALALELLENLAQNRQILLFTCQKREGLYLQNKPDVHLIRLNS